jgi:nitronate monooxygenase
MGESISRAAAFGRRFGLEVPILLAPMAGISAPALSIAVANAGGLGACGALLMEPGEIRQWIGRVRSECNGAVNLNLWIPDPPPARDAAHESRVREFLSEWGPSVSAQSGDSKTPDFSAQFEEVVSLRPPIISSVMGLYAAEYVARIADAGISWFANVSTLAEAKAAEAAGADVIVAQGMEAGGHRGCFDASRAEEQLVGLVALLPAIVDAVQLPVVATGGIADGRGVAAALALGASAVQIGTGFLRCPEAGIQPTWADALARTDPEDTIVSRAFSGRAGRSIGTNFVRAAAALAAPRPAPYPVQRGLTAGMRAEAAKIGDIHRMQAWAGQAAALARPAPAGSLVSSFWTEAKKLLS